MNVEIGAEAMLFPEKEYIKAIFVAVYWVQQLYKVETKKTGTRQRKNPEIIIVWF